MPQDTVTLTPDSLVGVVGSGVWPANSGDREDAVASDGGNYLTGDTDSEEVTFTLSNPVIDVSDGRTITSYDSVRMYMKAYTSDCRNPNITQVKLGVKKADGTLLVADNHDVTVNGGFPALYTGTVDSDSFSESDIQGLTTTVTLVDTEPSGNVTACDTVVDYIYCQVTYSYTAAPTTYTSGGDQVILDGGTLDFKNGMTVIGSKT